MLLERINLSAFTFGIIHSPPHQYGNCMEGGWGTPWLCKSLICTWKTLSKEWQLGLVHQYCWDTLRGKNQGMVLKSDMLYNIKCAFKYSLIWYLEHSGSGRGRVGRTKGAQSLRGCETGEQSEESPLDDFCIPTWGIVTPPTLPLEIATLVIVLLNLHLKKWMWPTTNQSFPGARGGREWTINGHRGNFLVQWKSSKTE